MLVILIYRGAAIYNSRVKIRSDGPFSLDPESNCTERHRRASSFFYPLRRILTKLEGTPRQPAAGTMCGIVGVSGIVPVSSVYI